MDGKHATRRLAKTKKQCDVTKVQNCEIIGLASILTKKKLKKAPLPKVRR